MNRTERITRRNQKIVKRYQELKSVKEFGVPKHSYKWMIANLSEFYNLAELTIERIILKNK